MATPAQIAANQANAEKSTGPRTEKGKAASRKNATRHGLCAYVTCLDDDDPDEVAALLADLNDEYQPVGATEEILVFKMAEQFWLNKRASYYLATHNMSEENCIDPEEITYETRLLALYLRYYTTTDRAFNRNLHDLRKLQKERKQQEAQQQRAAAAEIGSVSQNTAQPPAAPVETASNTPNPDPITPLNPKIPVAPAQNPHVGPEKQAA